jgi:hypothetical protein
MNISNKGQITKVPDGNAFINIAHGFAVVPDHYNVTFDKPLNLNDYTITIDATNLIVTWEEEPDTNVVINWEVTVIE